MAMDGDDYNDNDDDYDDDDYGECELILCSTG